MLNWLLRYAPAISIIDEIEPERVLDIGAGAHGLSWYWPGRVVQTDLAFEVVDELQRCGTAAFVVATADRLPFKDRAFDAVVSIDMLEHLPEAIREIAISEAFRVSRKLTVFAFPVGRSAELADRRLAALLRLARRDEPPWLREHLNQAKYPAVEDVVDGSPPTWRVQRVAREHHGWLQLAVVIAEMTPGFRRLTRRAERWAQERRLPDWLKFGPSYRSLVVFVPASVSQP